MAEWGFIQWRICSDREIDDFFMLWFRSRIRLWFVRCYYGNSFCLKLERDAKDIRCIRICEEFDNFQIIIDREKGRLTVDRSQLKMNFCQEYGKKRSLSFSPGKAICLDLYYDNTFAELFVNNGEEVMTFRAFPPSLKITAE